MKLFYDYQSVLETELSGIKEKGLNPKLLLHACCAPCSSYVIEYLREYFDITVYFFNPNIYPEQEYFRRLEEIRLFLKIFGKDQKIELIYDEYKPAEYITCVKGLESEKEGGIRCDRCFDLRLSKTAGKAKDMHFDYFMTTLTVSPHKNAEAINSIGIDLSKKYDIKYLVSDFKKKSGFKRSLELSTEYGLYRQTYCGCEFSV